MSGVAKLLHRCWSSSQDHQRWRITAFGEEAREMDGCGELKAVYYLERVLASASSEGLHTAAMQKENLQLVA